MSSNPKCKAIIPKKSERCDDFKRSRTNDEKKEIEGVMRSSSASQDLQQTLVAISSYSF